MSSITKVVVAGASGNLGPTIVNGLVDAGFTVTILTRKGSDHTYRKDVSVIPVDYDSVADLTNALQGQQGVVSLLGPSGFQTQVNLVEAAAQAGVQRFLPSEFGSDLDNKNNATFPPFQGKIKTVELLEAKARDTGLSYTSVRTGAFLDWGIEFGFLLNIRKKEVLLIDDGRNKFSATNLSAIAQTVVGIFRHPEETKNRAVHVSNAVVSNADLLAKVKKAVGSEGWTETRVSSKELLAGAWEKAKALGPEAGPGNALSFIQVSCFGGEDYGQPHKKTDNDFFGIEQLTDADVQAVVDSIAKRLGLSA